MYHTDSFASIENVDELVAARIELVRLQQEELQLVKQLLDVRATANAHRIKIDALVRDRNRTISRLPTELLVRIFDLFIHLGDLEGIYRRMQRLADVSRHWRDTILCTSTLWTYTVISPDDIPFLETRLKRSGSGPLDIVVVGWANGNNKTALIESLRIITPCADRWRSLTMDKSDIFVAPVIDEIKHLNFPSLQRVNMNLTNNHALPLPAFLSSKISPSLEHISLGYFILPSHSFTLSKLVTLELTNVGFLSPTIVLWQSPTNPSPFGNGVFPAPDSIILPVLRTLILHVHSPMQLLDAISAPMLECFNYSHQLVQKPDPVVFDRVKDKFRAVHQLTFFLGNKSYHPHDKYGLALCQALPSVRCLTIDASEMNRIFAPPGSQGCFMGNCNSLEKVMVLNRRSRNPDMDPLVQWLTHRITLGQGRLRVKLTGSFPSPSAFVTIYDRLRKCCILELDVSMLPLMHLSMSEHCPLRVVSASPSKSV